MNGRTGSSAAGCVCQAQRVGAGTGLRQYRQIVWHASLAWHVHYSRADSDYFGHSVMLYTLDELPTWTTHLEHQEVWAGPSWCSIALKVRSLLLPGLQHPSNSVLAQQPVMQQPAGCKNVDRAGLNSTSGCDAEQHSRLADTVSKSPRFCRRCKLLKSA
jgi:hypothetical protein